MQIDDKECFSFREPDDPIDLVLSSHRSPTLRSPRDDNEA